MRVRGSGSVGARLRGMGSAGARLRGLGRGSLGAGLRGMGSRMVTNWHAFRNEIYKSFSAWGTHLRKI